MKTLLQEILNAEGVNAKRNKKNVIYYNVAASIDIEVSSFVDSAGNNTALPYSWAFAVGMDSYIIGRELLSLVRILKWLSVQLPGTLIIYVHNLSYEFQFLRKYFDFETVFATDTRKVLYAAFGQIELRCSYLLSGLGLEALGKELTRHTVRKLVGGLDYEKLRTPRTPMSATERQYQINDVLTVNAYIEELIQSNDGINNIPLTKTGFARREFRALLKIPEYSKLIRGLKLSPDTYKISRAAFQGGFTHANVAYANQICEGVDSYDFSSSYPAVMVSEKFPMSSGVKVKFSVEKFEYWSESHCLIGYFRIQNLRLKEVGDCIISSSKCLEIRGRRIVDNGRLFAADEILVALTEIDYYSITQFYSYSKIELLHAYRFEKAYLPKEAIALVLSWFKLKTELKGIKEMAENYTAKKGMLNSLYGMSAQNPVKPDYIYADEWQEIPADVGEAIKSYNQSRTRPNFYPWGVYVTAYARRNLFRGILEYNSDYIYSDTDSLKVFDNAQHIDFIRRYNDEAQEKIIKVLQHYDLPLDLATPKNKKGIISHLGAWDRETDGHQYKMFKTLGAKRYLTYDGDIISMTVAGVSKVNGMRYLLDTCGIKYDYDPDTKLFHTSQDVSAVFDLFSDGLYFPAGKSGKIAADYIDEERRGIVRDYLGETYAYRVPSGTYMKQTDYNLGLSDYLEYIINRNRGLFE